MSLAEDGTISHRAVPAWTLMARFASTVTLVFLPAIIHFPSLLDTAIAGAPPSSLWSFWAKVSELISRMNAIARDVAVTGEIVTLFIHRRQDWISRCSTHDVQKRADTKAACLIKQAAPFTTGACLSSMKPIHQRQRPRRWRLRSPPGNHS